MIDTKKNTAVVFPGQGSQVIGMGADLYEKSSIAKDIFDEVDDTLGRKLTDIVFSGSQEILNKTENAQPAIMSIGIATIEILKSRGFEVDKISNISDFIHLDIVDKSFNPDCKDVKAYRSEVVRAYWPNKRIEVHIMSRTPSKWVKELYQHVDVIYIHPSIDESLIDIIDDINSNGVKAGIAIGVNEDAQIID